MGALQNRWFSICAGAKRPRETFVRRPNEGIASGLTRADTISTEGFHNSMLPATSNALDVDPAIR
jgi:hypothetical protein